MGIMLELKINIKVLLILKEDHIHYCNPRKIEQHL